jgi:hypothetical protein
VKLNTASNKLFINMFTMEFNKVTCGDYK